MRPRKHTLAGLGMRILAKGLLKMADKNTEQDNVIDFDPNEGAKVKLFVSNIKDLLGVKASDFAKQFVTKQKDCPDYLIDDEFGVVIVEQGLAKLFDSGEWENDDLLNIAAHALSLVIIDHVAEYYGVEKDEE
jgi:hypothetical protein